MVSVKGVISLYKTSSCLYASTALFIVTGEEVKSFTAVCTDAWFLLNATSQRRVVVWGVEIKMFSFRSRPFPTHVMRRESALHAPKAILHAQQHKYISRHHFRETSLVNFHRSVFAARLRRLVLRQPLYNATRFSREVKVIFCLAVNLEPQFAIPFINDR